MNILIFSLIIIYDLLNPKWKILQKVRVLYCYLLNNISRKSQVKRIPTLKAISVKTKPQELK